MSTLQAFALGAMFAWTPSLVFLACLIWRAPLIDDTASEAINGRDCERDQRSSSKGHRALPIS
jgi:hypothetical protein